MSSAALTPGYAGHPDADLMALLSTELHRMQLPVIVALGTQADAENATGARVFFIEAPAGGLTYAPVRLQPADGQASKEEQRAYEVAIYAPDAGVLVRLCRAVADKLDYLLSWTACDVGKPSKRGPVGTGAGSAGFGLTLPVTIKGPVYREVYGTATAETVTISTMAAEANGAGVEAIPPDPIAVS